MPKPFSGETIIAKKDSDSLRRIRISAEWIGELREQIVRCLISSSPRIKQGIGLEMML